MDNEEVFYFKIGFRRSSQLDALSREEKEDLLNRNYWFFTLRFEEEEDGKTALAMCEERDWFEVQECRLEEVRSDEMVDELNTHMTALFKDEWDTDLHAIKWFKREPG